MTEETAAALGRATGAGIANILIFAFGVYMAIKMFGFFKTVLLGLTRVNYRRGLLSLGWNLLITSPT